MLRAQRVLSKVRVLRIMDYNLGNPNDYTFSSLVAAIDRLPRPSRMAAVGQRLGFGSGGPDVERQVDGDVGLRTGTSVRMHLGRRHVGGGSHVLSRAARGEVHARRREVFG